MKLCTLCHYFARKRRWLILPIALVLALLLSFVVPTWLWLTLCAALLLMSSMLLIYLRDLGLLWGSHHVRQPAPRDAMAEIVMVDASLVDHGVCLQSAAQPVKPAEELSMRLGSGALLLGTAMVFLAEDMSPSDSAAVLAAAARFKLRARALQERSPILRRGIEDGMRCVTMQDGAQERTYFMADEKTVAAACGSIWDERVRLMGQHDREHIHEAALHMAAGGRRVIAYATAEGNDRPVFLGLIALGDGLDTAALDELGVLRGMGLTLILRDDKQHPMDLAALRRQLDVPDLHARPDLHLCAGEPYPDSHCLTILRREDRSLLRPVTQLRDHFRRMSVMLERLCALMGLCFLCCILAGGALSVPFAAAILTSAYLSFGSLTAAQPLRLPGSAVLCVCCLLVRLLLNAAVPEAAGAAGTCLCIALTALLSLTLAPHRRALTLRSLLPLLLTALGALLIQALLVLPLLPGALLALGFGLICGLLAGLLRLLVRR